jgi:hypothetical protein
MAQGEGVWCMVARGMAFQGTCACAICCAALVCWDAPVKLLTDTIPLCISPPLGLSLSRAHSSCPACRPRCLLSCPACQRHAASLGGRCVLRAAERQSRLLQQKHFQVYVLLARERERERDAWHWRGGARRGGVGRGGRIGGNGRRIVAGG